MKRIILAILLTASAHADNYLNGGEQRWFDSTATTYGSGWVNINQFTLVLTTNIVTTITTNCTDSQYAAAWDVANHVASYGLGSDAVANSYIWQGWQSQTNIAAGVSMDWQRCSDLIAALPQWQSYTNQFTTTIITNITQAWVPITGH